MLNKPVLIITFVVLILCTLPLSGEDYTLGVLYLETETGESAPLKESDLQALTLALSEMMISDLSSLQILTLVEREEINRIIEEQKLALSGMIEKSSAARVGKLLGARFLLTGRVVFTDRLVTLSCRISNVESGAVVSSATVNGTVENLFILQEALLEKLLTQWDIPLSRSEWDQLAERSNVSLNGLIRFGNALYASDKGDYEEALRYFEEALEISPGFRLAKESLEAIKKRFDDFLSHREMDLPAEIMEAIDRTAAKEPGADQEMQKMYWAYLQPMMLALSYYGSWAALPEESREWFFAETIQPSWAQMGLPSEPESMQEMAEYLGRRIYKAQQILEYLLNKELPLKGYNAYVHPVEGMTGYFLILFVSLSSSPEWEFPPMIDSEGNTVAGMEEYYQILLSYCDMFLENFPYSSYSGTVTPLMQVLLEKVK